MNAKRAEPSAYQPSVVQRYWNWFNPFQRGLGMLAFVLNRITGLGLVLYLGIHLVVLSLLAGGETRWDAFLEIVRSPFFLIMDVVLFAGLLIHGLNGVRITLVGLGIGAAKQKVLFAVLMVAGLIVLIFAAVGLFTV